MTDLKPLTILIVEDENDLRRETAAFLELYFRNVYQAAEGRRALALFDSEKLDMLGRDLPLLANDAEAALPGMPWPGNIRQLESIIRRAVLNADTVITGLRRAKK